MRYRRGFASAILKLDLLIVPYAFLSYWTKYIDQANINNAYVSGMEQDLNLRGNDLVNLQTMYTVGAVVGQIPFAYLFTKYPISWLIPGMDILWGVFTLLQYRATSYGEMMAYRFLVGWFEAAFFPGMHYIFGSWYRSNEIARRGGCFYVGLTLGTLTASLIQAGASSRLDGVHGLSGWRWMYIICALITIPIGVLGFFFWLLLWLDTFFWNACLNTSSGGYLLWLKSLSRYATSELNNLSAISPGAGHLLRPAWAIAVSHAWNIIGLVILVVWHVPESALWFAFLTTYSSVAMSSVLYGWLNSELRYEAADRAVVLVVVNMVAQSTTAWTPLLVYKTVDAPRFTKGYSFTLANAVCLVVMALAMWYLGGRKRALEAQGEGGDVESSCSAGSESGREGEGVVRVTQVGKTGE
ncbi:MFS general substrate transporter [Aspergillus ellipticus CBS 707.79]|uniref:MFS general substrate transporter n=1 Tax=Aspergillus ellipticus CBS 707.79 TaxID=1448320 RepID=A0A319CXV9_9EURO|nr:MFS general substrate transporter [Aspergillus ellipticus CBS 707.79]